MDTLSTADPTISDEKDALAATQGLICAYEEALKDVERSPAVAWHPWSTGPLGGRIRVPHVRSFVRQFMVVHARRTVSILIQLHHAQVAMSVVGPANEDRGNVGALKLLEHYDSSLARRAMSL